MLYEPPSVYIILQQDVASLSITMMITIITPWEKRKG